jgi:ABC-2 type transport system ATP-binding protein
VILIRGLTKTFRRVRVLDELNLEVQRGERIALIGSNGAGKTSLIRCLLGEYTHEGSVTIDGVAPRAQRTAVLGKIGFVPQLPPPLRMPVGQLIEYAAALCGAPPQSIVEVAGRLGLDARSIWRRPFVRLSGGMKQKLLIAIALGHSAELLILDEPAANLDPPARQVLFELLAERQARATMLISSHRLNEVSGLVNRVVELDLGRIALDERAAATALGGRLACRIVAHQPEPGLLRTLQQWDFSDPGEEPPGTHWVGTISAADRWRFVGALSPHMAATRSVSMTEVEAGADARD